MGIANKPQRGRNFEQEIICSLHKNSPQAASFIAENRLSQLIEVKWLTSGFKRED